MIRSPGQQFRRCLPERPFSVAPQPSALNASPPQRHCRRQIPGTRCYYPHHHRRHPPSWVLVCRHRCPIPRSIGEKIWLTIKYRAYTATLIIIKHTLHSHLPPLQISSDEADLPQLFLIHRMVCGWDPWLIYRTAASSHRPAFAVRRHWPAHPIWRACPMSVWLVVLCNILVGGSMITDHWSSSMASGKQVLN